MARYRFVIVAALVACAPPVEQPPDDVGVALSLEQQTRRVSMALRGIPATTQEIHRVQASPDALSDLADEWMQSPAFGSTIRHMHAELLLTRTSASLPALGPLQGTLSVDIAAALSEEPLALAEHIVMNDRPYTELVTADYTVVHPLTEVIFTGVTHPGGEGMQVAKFTDGRPAAGILSTNGLWFRHGSNGMNYNRGRTNMLADALLCADFLGRDIPLSGDLDVSDPDAVADAINTQTECVGCHQSMDPIASHLFVMRNRVAPFQIRNAYAGDCARDGSCYPIDMYLPRAEQAWRRFGLREPGYYGQPSDDLGTLGAHIAADPRFATCTARRFYSYLTQTPPDEVPIERAAELQTLFLDSGYDAKALTKAIVLSDEMLRADGDATGLLAIRPIQLAATVEHLTGFRYVVNVDNERCQRRGACQGDLDLVLDDTIGFRSMIGGIDGARVTRPTHTTTPTKVLYVAALADEAAGYVVDRDFAAPAERRSLLTMVDVSTTDETAVRDQLAALHQRFYGSDVDANSEPIDQAYALFQAGLSHATRDQVPSAWKLTLSGMLQDPQLLHY